VLYSTHTEMKNILLINKKEGETPLEAMEVFRSKNKKYKDVKMTYAGRLDPMASGLLLVLVGGEVHNKEKYLQLDKEYEFQVLFGFATDTYDILGRVEHSHILENVEMLEKGIKGNLKHFKGKFIQKYPLYSSKTVKGKQLFEYGREGVDVEIPERGVVVKKLNFVGLKKITSKKLLTNIEKRIKKVNGDFRQAEILKIWHKNLGSSNYTFYIAKFQIKCGSGTYVRSIANSLGEKMNIPALAFSIKRTKVGKWSNIYK
jgi:tRNA pseudouridine55 synthase